jgi:hypothetical protein
MNKILVFFALIFCFSLTSNLLAQDQVAAMKKHYNIFSSNENEDLTLFEQALTNYSELDQFRFFNQRRTIKFSGTNVSIELFSANELLTDYGKEVAPLTIMPGTFYKPVDFMITDNDEILTVYPLFMKQDPIKY